MTIEIHQPQLEALIEQRMASGRFQTIEDVLIQALEAAPFPDVPSAKPFGQQLVNLFAEARAILGGAELDLTRDSSSGRPVDLS